MKRKKILAVSAISIYVTIFVAILSIYVDTNERAREELSKLGPNIIVRPKLFKYEGSSFVENSDEMPPPTNAEGYINIEEVAKIKRNIKWRNNIVGILPVLYFPAIETKSLSAVMVQGIWFEREMKVDDNFVFKTGLRETFPNWQIKGAFPKNYENECLISNELSERLNIKCNDTIEIKFKESQIHKLKVTGIVRSSYRLREQVFIDLERLQEITEMGDVCSRIYVRALTKPEEEAPKNPRSLPPKEFERWLCSPYPSTIAANIEDNLNSVEATPITKITTAEAKFLKKCEGIFITLLIGGLICVIIGSISYVNYLVFSRRYEISVMKALGSTNWYIAFLFIFENLIIGMLGGFIGFMVGSFSAGVISGISFGHGIRIYYENAIVAIIASMIITFLATSFVVYRLNKINIASLLKRE